MAVIHSLKGSVFILTGELAVIDCLSNSFSSICLFPKKVGSSYVFFHRHYIYFYRILAAIHSFILYIFVTLKFAAINFCQRTFFQRILELQSPRNKLLIEPVIFSEQHRLY